MWERFKREWMRTFEGLGWIGAAIAGAAFLTMPAWMILLGWI